VGDDSSAGWYVRPCGLRLLAALPIERSRHVVRRWLDAVVRAPGEAVPGALLFVEPVCFRRRKKSRILCRTLLSVASALLAERTRARGESRELAGFKPRRATRQGGRTRCGCCVGADRARRAGTSERADGGPCALGDAGHARLQRPERPSRATRSTSTHQPRRIGAASIPATADRRSSFGEARLTDGATSGEAGNQQSAWLSQIAKGSEARRSLSSRLGPGGRRFESAVGGSSPPGSTSKTPATERSGPGKAERADAGRLRGAPRPVPGLCDTRR
jgi:hypothetical protein